MFKKLALNIREISLTEVGRYKNVPLSLLCVSSSSKPYVLFILLF